MTHLDNVSICVKNEKKKCDKNCMYVYIEQLNIRKIRLEMVITQTFTILSLDRVIVLRLKSTKMIYQTSTHIGLRPSNTKRVHFAFLH